jgi:DNA-binding MarR family transcriptional regulator
MNYQSPEDCPYYLITRASLAATAALKREMDSRGLTDVTPAYLGVLMCLWQGAGMDEVLGKLGAEDGMRITDLGRCAGLEPSTMTGLLDRMERDGLVHRANDPQDRRALQIHLTERGAGVRDQIFEAVDALFRELFAGIDPGQMETARWVLKKILSNAGKGKP